MTYGSYARTASNYRDLEVLSASPAQLIVILYDHALVHLTRLGTLGAPHDLDARSQALERVRAAISELLLGVDTARGGAIATHLASIYSFLLGELSTLGVRYDARRVARLTTMVRELRDAFARAATMVDAPQAVG